LAGIFDFSVTGWTPPSIPRHWLAATVILYVLFLGYSIFIAGQLLLGVVPAVAIVSVYLPWRFLVAVEAIADAQQRIASQREED
jgi:CHASE2 domain-containing sensor protein